MKQLTAKLKSRGATAAVLTLALGAAVYLNWSFSRGAPPSLLVSDTTADAVETAAAAPVTDQLAVEAAAAAEDTETSAVDDADKNYGEAQLVSVNQDSGTEFFESARLTRSKARDEALDTLKKSLKDAGLTKEEKDALTAELSARISNITLETKLETLIKSKGFPDCVVNLEGSKANVTVMTENDALTAEEVTRVRDALLSQCKGLDSTGHHHCGSKITPIFCCKQPRFCGTLIYISRTMAKWPFATGGYTLWMYTIPSAAAYRSRLRLSQKLRVWPRWRLTALPM